MHLEDILCELFVIYFFNVDLRFAQALRSEQQDCQRDDTCMCLLQHFCTLALANHFSWSRKKVARLLFVNFFSRIPQKVKGRKIWTVRKPFNLSLRTRDFAAKQRLQMGNGLVCWIRSCTFPFSTFLGVGGPTSS